MARKSKHVRLFLNAAKARLGEAAFLHEYDFTMGAVYLAGYAVECTLKALVLDCHPEHEQPAVIARFRGALAHDFGWLLDRYLETGGAAVPPTVMAALSLLQPWGTDLRYNPRTQYPGDAAAFFAAVEAVSEWANGRL